MLTFFAWLFAWSRGGHSEAIDTKGIWKFIDGELVQVEEERQRYIDEEEHHVKVLRKRVDGELREVNRVVSREGGGEFSGIARSRGGRRG